MDNKLATMEERVGNIETRGYGPFPHAPSIATDGTLDAPPPEYRS